MSHFLSRLLAVARGSSSRLRDSRCSLPPAPCLPTPRNRSLHFANRNRPNSMKTSAEEKFNRYTFRAIQTRPWLCALGDPGRRSGSVAPRSPGRFARSSSPAASPILLPGLEIDAND
jgi:hypothetical protein